MSYVFVMSLWAPVWIYLHVLLAYVCACLGKSIIILLLCREATLSGVQIQLDVVTH